jgi:FixJ family two-component response regulator
MNDPASLAHVRGLQVPEASIIHVVECNDQARTDLVSTLATAGLHVLAFSSPDSFLAAWRPDRHGCLLLDIHFPGFNGLEFQADLHDLAVPLPIILMSERVEFPPCVWHLKPGTVHLLVKPVGQYALFARVAAACEQDFARFRADMAVAALITRYNSLTAREKQVLSLVSEGLMNKQIAAALNLSVITVKVHRATMMRKMEWRSLVQAVRGADALKIYTVPSLIQDPPKDTPMMRYGWHFPIKDSSQALVRSARTEVTSTVGHDANHRHL